MDFELPQYTAPDFVELGLENAPLVEFKPVEKEGVAPENYHATSIFPEYFHMGSGIWHLPRQSRMDCVVVQQPGNSTANTLEVREFRSLRAGEMVACGRREDGEDGIYLHTDPFGTAKSLGEKFAFRTRMTRESSFSIDYDELYELLEHERENGFIAWVVGPATIFDHDARQAFANLVRKDYVHAILAGNALATHDIEASIMGTALGQDVYTKKPATYGHYNHLDTLNTIRKIGSIKQAVKDGIIKNGVMHALVEKNVPFVLAGSIRDDGPLPEVIASAYSSQDHMRALVKKATTIITMATQLHSIAVGNMTPSYTVTDDGVIRPVFFYNVDMSEFAINKLANRGSLSAHSILTNVQDFLVTVERGLTNT